MLSCREVSRRVIIGTGIASTILAGSKNAGALTPLDIVKRQGEVSRAAQHVHCRAFGAMHAGMSDLPEHICQIKLHSNWSKQ
jgi:hypothetical protein